MKTAILLAACLIPTLAIAEVTVNTTPKGGQSATYTPSTTKGTTASGTKYERTTTAPGVSSTTVQGVNGSLEKTTTAPGVSTLEVQGVNGATVSREQSGAGNSTLQVEGTNGYMVDRYVEDGNKYTYVDTPKYDTSRTSATDGAKSADIQNGGTGVAITRGDGQPTTVYIMRTGEDVTTLTGVKSTTAVGNTEVTVTKANQQTGAQEGQKTFVIVTPTIPPK